MSKRILSNNVMDEVSRELGESRVVVPTGFEAKLPWLAPAMNISSKLSDYFFRPTPILVSDLPNRNGVGFSLQSLIAWNTNLHCQSYEGWRYCPMFEEHRSDDISTAVGVVADVTMRKLLRYGGGKLWVVIALTAVDRTKNVPLARQYESGEITTVSMGAMAADPFQCSYCGADEGTCSHLDPEKDVVFYELNGKLVYRMVREFDPYELSIVRDPAVGLAVGSDRVLRYTSPL